MRNYLAYSLGQAQSVLPIKSWVDLTPENHESLAAFRVRFSDYQEKLGKTMRAIAIEEEQQTEPYGAVLAYMEKLGIIGSVQIWKEIRELRNAVNHEYDENPEKVASFFEELAKSTPILLAWHTQLEKFCAENYGLSIIEQKQSTR